MQYSDGTASTAYVGLSTLKTQAGLRRSLPIWYLVLLDMGGNNKIVNAFNYQAVML
jgi:hypothetical protein